MNQNRHAQPVRFAEDVFQLVELFGVLELKVGCGQMQLEPAAKSYLVAVLDGSQCIWPDRVDAAETN